MSTPTLAYRAADTIDFPDLDILGRRVSPYVIDVDDADYVDLSLEYTIDDEDAVLALHLFLRNALPGETNEAVTRAETTALSAEIAGLGLHAQVDRESLEDRHEISLTLYGPDLVLGLYATSEDAAVTDAAIDFALSHLVPHFLRND